MSLCRVKLDGFDSVGFIWWWIDDWFTRLIVHYGLRNVWRLLLYDVSCDHGSGVEQFERQVSYRCEVNGEMRWKWNDE